MKDKNLNILSPRTSNPLLYIIYNWHSSPIVLIWTVNIRNIHFVNIAYYFSNLMSRNLGSFPLPVVTLCHISSTPYAPLTCDVIYGCPFRSMTCEFQGKLVNMLSLDFPC